jgi:predicted RNase H-like nuclease
LHTFIGVDLGWYGKPTGLASIELAEGGLWLRRIARMEGWDAIVAWIETEASGGNAVVAIDAPTVIRNAAGIRPAERQLNRDFRRFHAGCHAANLGRPFAQNVLSFSGRLESAGFQHGSDMPARADGRFQIEVHPHAACVSLFQLPRIVKYKRGTRGIRAAGLRRLRRLMLTSLPALTPAFTPRLPVVPKTGNLKPAEDQIDAVMCAYIAAHWWHWGPARNVRYGDRESGYIVVPTVLPVRNDAASAGL